MLAANLEADVFGRLVAGRTVAVVGNGPGCLGAGLGPEIDAHDLVVRFNNYPSGYEADYGARTDVWVRGAHRDVRDRPEIEDLQLVVWEMDFFRNLLELPEHGDVLHRDTQFSPEKVTHVGTASKQALRDASGLLLPTSGAQLLWLLREARGDLRGVDVYGFSTIDGSEELGHYFDALGDMGHRHDAGGEGAFLRSLLADGTRGAGASDAVVTDELAARRSTRSGADVHAGEVTVVSCAYRQYDPATGKTGGPGGVLATQRLALGDEYRGQELAYVFDEGGKGALRDRLSVQLTGLSAKVADLVLGAEYVRTAPRSCARRRRAGGSCWCATSSGRRTELTCSACRTCSSTTSRAAHVRRCGPSGASRRRTRPTSPTGSSGSSSRTPARCTSRASGRARPTGRRRASTRRGTWRSPAPRSTTPSRPWTTTTVLAPSPTGDAPRRSVARAPPPGQGRAHRRLRQRRGLQQRQGARPRPRAARPLRRAHGTQGRLGGGGRRRRPRAVPGVPRRAEGPTLHGPAGGERMEHDKLLALLDYADYYVMLHRSSIFDLAMLEAMRAGKPLVLSPVGGNLEVDLDGNVLFVDEGTLDDACRVIESRDRVAWGERNRKVFEDHFSLEHFAERYRAMLDEQLDALLEPAPSDAAEGRAS
ncbi:glycosyltransferase family 29 protein [Luteimicrobium album]|uniref:glycosyltransferase family 29 protein n=1 Tax=Luteimicrobium album TaxID=1054550 RepID=UPI0024E047A8|nr:glycosyltransferase family 29 protein [Luteimicrobium album]